MSADPTTHVLLDVGRRGADAVARCRCGWTSPVRDAAELAATDFEVHCSFESTAAALLRHIDLRADAASDGARRAALREYRAAVSAALRRARAAIDRRLVDDDIEPADDPFAPGGPLALTSRPRDASAFVQQLIRSLRTHLDLDVAFVSHLTPTARTFRVVDADGPSPVRVGATDPRDESWCALVVAGRLPMVIPDAAAHPIAAALPATSAVPIGAHLSVPIELEDGSVYGTLCCFAHEARPTLNERDLATMRMVASVIAAEIESNPALWDDVDEWATRIETVLADAAIGMVFQPVLDLGRHRVIGYEALSRFPGDHGPDEWFAAAHRVGRGHELELAAVASALAWRARLPSDAFLSINVSPQVFIGDAFLAQLDRLERLDGVTFEVTEREVIIDFEAIKSRSAEVRARGGRIAVDDVGAGYAGLRHVLELGPDILKLDRSVVAGIDCDPRRQAMVRAWMTFGSAAGVELVAEGIETAAELDRLRQLGLAFGQGYHLGRPGPLP